MVPARIKNIKAIKKMASNLDTYKDDLRKLVDLGDKMFLDLTLRELEKRGKLDKEQSEQRNKINGTFDKEYQRWYTESHAVVRQLASNRLGEFEVLYKGEGRRKDVNLTTYTIQDWLKGIQAGINPYTEEKYFNDLTRVYYLFKVQLEVLKSVQARLESSLFNIKHLVQADLFDSELDAARELLKNGFLRGAGVVAGVVLEAHLSQICGNHGATTRKKNPTISDFNDLLKANNMIDVPQWRFIQRLGDLRNLCGHKKKREPTEEEVSELIDGVEKIIKTLF